MSFSCYLFFPVLIHCRLVFLKITVDVSSTLFKRYRNLHKFAKIYGRDPSPNGLPTKCSIVFTSVCLFVEDRVVRGKCSCIRSGGCQPSSWTLPETIEEPRRGHTKQLSNLSVLIDQQVYKVAWYYKFLYPFLFYLLSSVSYTGDRLTCRYVAEKSNLLPFGSPVIMSKSQSTSVVEDSKITEVFDLSGGDLLE